MNIYAVKAELIVQDFNKWQKVEKNDHRHLRFSLKNLQENYAINNLFILESSLSTSEGLRILSWYSGDKQDLESVGVLTFGPNLEHLGSAKIIEIGPEIKNSKQWEGFVNSLS